MSEEQQENIVSAVNKKYNEFNVMKIRLDTQPLIQDIEVYLRGARLAYVTDEEGRVRQKRISFGYAKANEKGIQSILSWLSLHINPHTVQGNFMTRGGVSEEFSDFMYHFHLEFARYIMVNLYDFDIDETEFQGMIVSIRNAVERFLSRSIDNLERESYGETTRSIESNRIQAKGGGFNLFGGNHQ
jgi:hypothetical protein